jgi:hypothetical protein
MTATNQPFPARPTPSVEEQQAQRDIRDRLAHVALLATDNIVIDNAAAIAALPSAYRSRITVEAAIGYLIAEGLIRVTPDDEWPEYVSLELPDYLKPDIAGATANHARVTAAMFLDRVAR